MNRNSRPPTILIDASDIDKPSGGRTAVLDLFRVLFARQLDWRYIVMVSRYEESFEFPYVRQIIVPFRNRLLERLWIQSIVSYLALTRRVDLVHFARTIGGIAWPAWNILTIFDVTTLRYPKLHARSAVWFWQYVQPRLIRWADHVLAISQNVKDDLVQDFGVPPEKIMVVYCAPKNIFYEQKITPRYLSMLREKYHLPNRYILFIGMIARKKNLPTLIRALYLLKQRHAGYVPLVIAGRRYRQSDDVAIFEQIHALGLDSDIHYIGSVEDKDLPGLYYGADVFVFPSLHEGFGIPCVEAMLCQTPVIAARSGAVPEIVGDAALLVADPLDASGFADAIDKVLTDSVLYADLVSKGSQRAGHFHWSVSAERVLDLYCQVLSGEI